MTRNKRIAAVLDGKAPESILTQKDLQALEAQVFDLVCERQLERDDIMFFIQDRPLLH